MDPLLALAIQNLGPGNTSQCMNRLLPHKRLGLLGEVMSDGARTAAELPSCAVIDYTLEYGSQQRPARLRSEQWRKCLSCGLKSSLQPSEFSSGSERLRAATEAASLVHLGAAGVKQIVNDRPIDARLQRHSVAPAPRTGASHPRDPGRRGPVTTRTRPSGPPAPWATFLGPPSARPGNGTFTSERALFRGPTTAGSFEQN